jgi:hypothetical protein
VDGTISNTKLFGKYVLAVLKYWYVVATGLVLTVVDLFERSLRTWWVFPQWAILSSAVVILAAAQFLAYRDLHLSHLAEMKALRDEKDAKAEKHRTEKAAHQQEIEKLRRPYDKAQVELVKDKLRGLDQTALGVLRFLLQNGPTGSNSMERQLSYESPVIDGAVANLSQRSLVTREVASNLGGFNTAVTLWRVNEKFDQVLPDVLFADQPKRTSAQQYHYEAAQSALRKLGPNATIALRHLKTHGALTFGMYPPILPSGMNSDQAMAIYHACAAEGLVTQHDTLKPGSADRTFKIAPMMSEPLDELLYGN